MKYIQHPVSFWKFIFRRAQQLIGLPEVVIIGSLLFVKTSLLLFYFIDLRNAFGIRDWLFSLDRVYFYFTYTPFFFQHYGRNSGFAELLQWGFLATAIALAFYLAGHFREQYRKLSQLCLLLGIGFVLMLVEDAGDIRHMLMSYVQLAAGEPDQGIYGTLFEAGYFAMLGGIPLYALIRYGGALRAYGKAFWYMVIGFVAYATAASLSFVGTAFQMLLDRDVYTIMGDGLVRLSYRLGDAALPGLWEGWNSGNWLYQVGFFLMDSLVEENIEIIAGALIVAALLSVKQVVLKKEVVSS